MAKPIYNLGYLAYYQVNMDYIIENYCVNKKKVELKCNGKCHLAKQLQQENNTDENTNNGLKLFSEMFQVVFYQSYNSYHVFSLKTVKSNKTYNFYNKLYNYTFYNSLLRPPIS